MGIREFLPKAGFVTMVSEETSFPSQVASIHQAGGLSTMVRIRSAQVEHRAMLLRTDVCLLLLAESGASLDGGSSIHSHRLVEHGAGPKMLREVDTQTEPWRMCGSFPLQVDCFGSHDSPSESKRGSHQRRLNPPNPAIRPLANTNERSKHWFPAG